MPARYSPETYDKDVLEDNKNKLRELIERARIINPPGSVYSNIPEAKRPEFDDILLEMRSVQAMIDRQTPKVVNKMAPISNKRKNSRKNSRKNRKNRKNSRKNSRIY
jgi:hypothetical protein